MYTYVKSGTLLQAFLQAKCIYKYLKLLGSCEYYYTSYCMYSICLSIIHFVTSALSHHKHKAVLCEYDDTVQKTSSDSVFGALWRRKADDDEAAAVKNEKQTLLPRRRK